MMLRSAVLALVALTSTAALAEDAPLPSPSIPDRGANAERMFPLGLSPVTHETRWHADTAGRASSAGSSAFRISQSVEMVPLNRLTVGVALEMRQAGTTDLNPEATVKYQFLDQASAGVNLAAGLKYKQVGFVSSGAAVGGDGEVEGIVSASRSFGLVVAMANAVVGTGIAEPDVDVEAFAGVGARFLKDGFVGLNGQGKWILGDAGEEIVAAGGRPSEYLGGLVVAYRFGGLLEASLLGGYLSPKGTTPAGPLAMAKLGLSF